MKTKFRQSLAAAAMAGSLLFAGAAAAVPAAAAPPSQSQSQPRATTAPTDVTGTVAGLLTGTLEGTFELTEFVVENGQLTAVGTIVDAVVQTATGPVPLPDIPVSIPVTDVTPSGDCKIVDLDLGPLHLDVLGLVIDLNEINLDITAVAGQGNLLGNLLCSVTGIFDRGTGLNGLANLLNNLLRL